MSPRQYLRELISDRLTAAAEEIFRAFESTINVYEEELERQRELLEGQRKPHDVPQQHGCKREVPLDKYLSDQEGNSSLDHVEPVSLRIKEDDDEIPISQEVLKQEAGTFTPTLDNGESGQIEAELVGDHELLSLGSPAVERLNQTGSKDEDKKAEGGGLDYQQKLLDCIFQPHLKFHLLEVPQLHVPEKEDVVLGDHQLCRRHENQNRQRIGIGPSHVETDREHQLLVPVAERPDQIEITLRDSGFLSTRPEKMRPNNEQNRRNASNKCETCGKTFSDKYKLMRHVRIHTCEKPFSCDLCAKRFNRSENLKVHMRTHTGERSFYCETCGKRFNQSQILQRHMRTHTGEKPFSCDTCGRRFNLGGNLKKHMRTHTGERPFPCGTCGKAFAQSEGLKVHARVHAGERSFYCDACGKCFHQRQMLQRHMQTHTSERPFSCETCGKRFKRRASLNVHVRSHAGEETYSCETWGGIHDQCT